MVSDETSIVEDVDYVEEFTLDTDSFPDSLFLTIKIPSCGLPNHMHMMTSAE